MKLVQTFSPFALGRLSFNGTLTSVDGEFLVFASMPRVFPMFSEQDKDLESLCWRSGTHPLNHYPRHNFHKNGKQKTVRAHRIVMQRMLGRELTPKEFVDHINHNQMDARRENLRLTDRKGNRQNINPAISPFRGTYGEGKYGWRAEVKVADKHIYLGFFKDRTEAARVAALKRRELGFLE